MSAPGSDDHDGFRPGRLGSIWAVISANLTGLAPLIYQLSMYQLLQERHDAEADHPISQTVKDQVTCWLKIATSVAKDFEIKAAHDRIGYFHTALEKSITWRALSMQCQVLREAIEAGLRGQLIYRYFDEEASVLMRWQEDWRPVIEKFPSATQDIRAAVDCWALGHGTASIFHSMRILEYGIAALARDVGREIGAQNWQNVIDQIESEVRDLGKKLPSGVAKNERLQFLSEAAKEMVYFKDGWRNYVSHNRGSYDRYQARSVLEHVRSFMTVLSTRLSEELQP
jgi:hypothetical protein